MVNYLNGFKMASVNVGFNSSSIYSHLKSRARVVIYMLLVRSGDFQLLYESNVSIGCTKTY